MKKSSARNALQAISENQIKARVQKLRMRLRLVRKKKVEGQGTVEGQTSQ